MRTWVPVVVAALSLLAFGRLGPEALGQVSGGSAGMGWCPICGKDQPLSHDFTHGDNRRKTPPPPPVDPDTYSIVSLYNRTDHPVSYSIRSFSGGGWTTNTIAAGRGYCHWHQSPGNFQIRFSGKVYPLEANVVTVPRRRPNFDEGRFYHFESAGSGFDLGTGAGIAASPHRESGDQPAAEDSAKDAFLTRLKQLADEGELAWSRREFHTALDRFSRALELAGQGPGYRVIADKPHYQRRMADAMHGLGREALEAGKFTEARSWFNQAIRHAVFASQAGEFRKSLGELDSREAALRQAEEGERTRAKLEVENRAKQQIGKIVEEGIRNLGPGIPVGSAPTPGAGGLRFDSVPGGTQARASSPGTGLEFPPVESPRMAFDKGAPGSAPVPVSNAGTANRKTPPANPVTKSLGVQMDVGKYGLGHVPTAMLSAGDSGLVNPLDETAKVNDEKLLAPSDLAKSARMPEAELEAFLGERRQAALRNALRRSGDDLSRALKKLEEAGVLRPDKPFLTQLNDPRVAAHVEAAVRKVQEQELQREQDAHAEVRNVRVQCQMEKEAQNEQARRIMEPIMRDWKEIETRLREQEVSEIGAIRRLWQEERDGFLDQLREQGYLGTERTFDEAVRRAKWDSALRMRIKVLQDLEQKRAQDEQKARDSYDALLLKEQLRVLREKLPPKP